MLDGIIKTKQKIIVADSGSVLHGMKKTDVGYNKFGEVYFSSVKKDVIKAWKLHKEMTLNLVVPIGEVTFVLFDDRHTSIIVFTKTMFNKQKSSAVDETKQISFDKKNKSQCFFFGNHQNQ